MPVVRKPLKRKTHLALKQRDASSGFNVSKNKKVGKPRAKILQFLQVLFIQTKKFFGYVLDTDREYILGNDALRSEANHDYNSNEKKDSLRFDDYSLLLDHCMRRFRNICKRRDRNSIHCRFIFCYNFSIQ